MRTACWIVLVLLGTGPGCVELPLVPQAEKSAPAKTTAATSTRAGKPVTADQVTEANSHQVKEALRQELDRDAETATAGEKPLK